MKKIDFKSLIVKETNDYLIVNKPPYFPTLDDRHEAQNMLALARLEFPDIQVCHRLDKETSGCLVFAKNPDAYRNIAMQFEDRKVEKVYHAVAEGIHDFDGIMVDRNLSASKNGIARIVPSGKPAQTIFKTVKSYFAHTLIACKPITGRLHQIRIHLAYLGAPICGDELYGGQPLYLSSIKRKFNLKKGTEERPIMQRVALHAFAISFTDLSGEKISAEAPYPKDFAVMIKQLEKTSK